MNRYQVQGLLIGGVLAITIGAAGYARLGRSAHVIHPASGKPITVPGQDGAATLLFNGWKVTPAGRPIPTGDMLAGSAISPDGRMLAIVNCGFSAPSLHLIDLAASRSITTIRTFMR